MNLRSFIIVFVGTILFTMSDAALPGWVEMEAEVKNSNAKKLGAEIAYESEADKSAYHAVTFQFIGKNADLLEKIVNEVSDPKNPKYGKHLSREEIRDLTMDAEGMEKVETYINQLNEQLASEGMSPVRISKKTDSSITAEASVGAWELAFNTTFFNTRHTDHEGKVSQLNRAKTYFLPAGLAPHVRMVSGTVQMPVPLHHGPVKIGLTKHHLEPHAHND